MTDHSILLNKYCIFRGSRSGVYSGFLRGIVMCGPVAYYHIEESRRLQYQKYNGMTLCSVPTMGLHPESRLSPKVQTHLIQVEDFSEVMPTTEAVASQIRSLPNGEIDGRPNAPLADEG